MFQFQNGTIKSMYRLLTRNVSMGFNSKMVRLKVGMNDIIELDKNSFNSKMVRLKVIEKLQYYCQ